MSVEAMAVVLHHSRAKGTAKLILLGIANHEGDGGAWPSVATLAKYANVTERNVKKALQQLAGTGEIRIYLQAGGPPDLEDHKRPNRYAVLVNCPPWCDRTSNHRDTRSRQESLWINRVSSTTPGVDSDTPGVSSATPPGVSAATPKPSTQPTSNDSVPAQLQTARDRGPCRTCSHAEPECARRQLLHPDGHKYEPPHRRSA